MAFSSFALRTFHRQSTRRLASCRSFSSFPVPRLFDYETVTSNLSVTDAIDSVEQAFGALAQGKVDVPMPMHSE